LPTSNSPENALVCSSCGQTYELVNGIPLFSQPPADLIPSEKIERSPELGTPWRRANWRFVQQQAARLAPEALILDVGAGRGDFAAALQGFRTVAVEVYPYPEIDVVCDLTRVNPFLPHSFDAILLLNVLEHVYDTHALMQTLADLLKPGGHLIVAIPFMVKLHQAPVDFVRFTHFALQKLAVDHHLQVELLEGYYDPLFFLGEGIGNIRNAALPDLLASQRLSKAGRLAARLYLKGIQIFANLLGRLLGPGKLVDPDKTRSMAPTGYHILYRKEENT
jgi:SAM-dependent methyltransferase